MTPKVFLRIGLVAVVMFGPGVSPARAQGVEAEALMAAFVHRFTQFVEWPAAALEGRDEFEICAAASDEFVRALQRLIADTQLGGRPLVARHVGPRDMEGCQVLFVSQAVGRVESFVVAADGRPVLTISDQPGFLDMSGMIELRIIDRRIRFAVNAEAASRVGLRSSAQLLELALEVRGSGT